MSTTKRLSPAQSELLTDVRNTFQLIERGLKSEASSLTGAGGYPVPVCKERAALKLVELGLAVNVGSRYHVALKLA